MKWSLTECPSHSRNFRAASTSSILPLIWSRSSPFCKAPSPRNMALGKVWPSISFSPEPARSTETLLAVYRDAFFDAAGAVNGVNPNDRGIIGKPNTDHEVDWGFTCGRPTAYSQAVRWARQDILVREHRKVSPDLGAASGNGSNRSNREWRFQRTGHVRARASQIPIFVPIAWQADPSLMPAGCDPGAAPGEQFPGNVIPRSCFSAVSKSLLGFIPKPTSSGEIDNFQPGFVPILAHTVWGFTLDHNINPKQAIHGAYWRNRGTDSRRFRRQSTEQHNHQPLVWQWAARDLLSCNYTSPDADRRCQLDH